MTKYCCRCLATCTTALPRSHCPRERTSQSESREHCNGRKQPRCLASTRCMWFEKPVNSQILTQLQNRVNDVLANFGKSLHSKELHILLSRLRHHGLLRESYPSRCLALCKLARRFCLCRIQLHSRLHGLNL